MYFEETEEFEEMYEFVSVEEDDYYENEMDHNTCDDNEERVWDSRTGQFQDRTEVWCSFEDDQY
jgi:hypothetical protein